MFVRSIARISVVFASLTLAGLLVTGCDTDPPTGAQTDAPHSNGLLLATGGNSALAHGNPELAQALDDLGQLSAGYHDLDNAKEAGYSVLFKVLDNPNTAENGTAV